VRTMKTEVEDRVKTSEDRVKTSEDRVKTIEDRVKTVKTQTEDNAEDSGQRIFGITRTSTTTITTHRPSQRTIAALPPLIIYPLVPRNRPYHILRRQTLYDPTHGRFVYSLSHMVPSIRRGCLVAIATLESRRFGQFHQSQWNHEA
jgi:hypothetical protein